MSPLDPPPPHTRHHHQSSKNNFPPLLHLLQSAHREVVAEEAFLAWADEKAHADEAERLYLNKAATFIDWLRTADEDEEEEEDD